MPPLISSLTWLLLGFAVCVCVWYLSICTIKEKKKKKGMPVYTFIVPGKRYLYAIRSANVPVFFRGHFSAEGRTWQAKKNLSDYQRYVINYLAKRLCVLGEETFSTSKWMCSMDLKHIEKKNNKRRATKQKKRRRAYTEARHLSATNRFGKWVSSGHGPMVNISFSRGPTDHRHGHPSTDWLRIRIGFEAAQQTMAIKNLLSVLAVLPFTTSFPLAMNIFFFHHCCVPFFFLANMIERTSLCYLHGFVFSLALRMDPNRWASKGEKGPGSGKTGPIQTGMCFFMWNYMSVANRDRHIRWCACPVSLTVLDMPAVRDKLKEQEKKKSGGGYECGRQKLKWLSVNVKNNNKENFFFFSNSEKKWGTEKNNNDAATSNVKETSSKYKNNLKTWRVKWGTAELFPSCKMRWCRRGPPKQRGISLARKDIDLFGPVKRKGEREKGGRSNWSLTDHCC